MLFSCRGILLYTFPKEVFTEAVFICTDISDPLLSGFVAWRTVSGNVEYDVYAGCVFSDHGSEDKSTGRNDSNAFVCIVGFDEQFLRLADNGFGIYAVICICLRFALEIGKGIFDRICDFYASDVYDEQLTLSDRKGSFTDRGSCFGSIGGSGSDFIFI